MTEGKPCWDLLLLAGALSLDSFAGDLFLFLRLPRLSIDCYIIVTLAAIVSLLHLRITGLSGTFITVTTSSSSSGSGVGGLLLLRLVAHTYSLPTAYGTPTRTNCHDGATNGPHGISKTG